MVDVVFIVYGNQQNKFIGNVNFLLILFYHLFLLFSLMNIFARFNIIFGVIMTK